MVTYVWVNIGSGNGLVPDSTKPLPEPVLTDHYGLSVVLQLCAQDINPLMGMNITHLKIIKCYQISQPMS